MLSYESRPAFFLLSLSSSAAPSGSGISSAATVPSMPRLRMTVLEDRAEAKERSWEIMIPIPSKSFSAFAISSLLYRSRWLVGSSRISSSGEWERAARSWSLFFSPPDSSCSRSIISSVMESVDLSIPTWLSPENISAQSSGLRPSNTCGQSMASPLLLTRPLSGSSSPAAIDIRVLLPTPFAPAITVQPWLKDNDRSENSMIPEPGYEKEIPSISKNIRSSRMIKRLVSYLDR